MSLQPSRPYDDGGLPPAGVPGSCIGAGRMSRIETVRVDSWDAALQALYADSWSAPLGRFRSSIAFRGVCRLERSLRHGLQQASPEGAGLEPHLLRSFRKYAHHALPVGHDSPWHWLALAQHHGLPTRLLDWSYSPFVALHFATDDPATWDADGAVWCVDYAAARRELPPALARVLDADGADVFTPDLIAQAVERLSDLAALAADPCLVFLEPPSLDERIVNQYALFSLLSTVDADHEAWLDAHPGLARCVVIERRAKAEIRDKLDQANVTERVLFPGLDGLCRWLRRYYEPRAGALGGERPPAAAGVRTRSSGQRYTEGL